MRKALLFSALGLLLATAAAAAAAGMPSAHLSFGRATGRYTYLCAPSIRGCAEQS